MSLPVVLFIDEVCPFPYDANTLAERACGGTESSVIRVAEGLAATGLFRVIVEQHCRHPHVTRDYQNPEYTRTGCTSHADYVVSLRSPETLRKAKQRFPKARRHYVWAHDLGSAEWAHELVKHTDFTTIAVSNFHKTQLQQALYPQWYGGQFPINVVYNPIPDSLLPDETPYDKNKLVWTSSPHKNLPNALAIFENLRSFNPDFRLYVANPGYLPDYSESIDGVIPLGSLPHHEVIKHVREALCLYYPNWTFAETFGISMVEANAVGTPVLTHGIGAAREVLFHPSETTECRNPKNVIDRVLAWHSGNRPKVKANQKFRLSSVISSWRRLFNV